jgi:hypothetical protein
MINVEKHHLNCFYTTIKFEHHDTIKDQLLQLITNQYSESISLENRKENNYPSVCYDVVSKLDWCYAKNFNRDWVQYLTPYLSPYLDEFSHQCGYSGFTIFDIWFQQYIKNNRHGWHQHAGNFTGIYYLQLPESSPKTEILEPFNQQTTIVPDCVEGDILIIPSFAIHRAPMMHTSDVKTIISWNFDVNHIRKNIVTLNLQEEII